METTAEELFGLVQALNPVPERDLERLRANLPHLELDESRHRRISRRTVFIGGFVAAALLATGVAIADGVNPFTGIGAAAHTRGSQDVLPAAVVKALRLGRSAAFRSVVGSLRPDTSRLIGQLSSGRNVYVASTTTGVLDIIVTDGGKLTMSSGVPPLSATAPITIAIFRRDHATPPISYGIVRNGITAVSFRGGGSEHTVPVKDNVWVYEGDSSALESITVHYADGRMRTITH
jgi:hypothetical protein